MSSGKQKGTNVLKFPEVYKKFNPENQGESWVARQLRAAIELVDATDIPPEAQGDALVKVIKTVHRLARNARGGKS